MINNGTSHIRCQWAIRKEKCDEIIDFCEEKLTNDSNSNEELIPDVRKSKVYFVEENKFADLAWDHVKEINHMFNFNFDLEGLENMQYTQYFDDGEYNWHCDTLSQEYPDSAPEELVGKIRKMSVSILLNDPSEFEGGEFQLVTGLPSDDDYIKTIELGKGDMIIFPSFVPHRITKVEKGCRKSLVGWVYGPPFK